jgi:hypothetical protein
LADNKAEVREEKKEAKAAGPAAAGNATNGTATAKPVPYGPRD